MKDVKLLTQKVIDLLDELERYQYYKEQFLLAVNNLFNEYQRGHYTYFQYEQELKKILKDKTREEWLEYYNAYLYSLLKSIEAYNDQIFYDVYQDRRFEELGKKEISVIEKIAAPAEVLPHIKRKVVLQPLKAKPPKEAFIEPIPGLPKEPTVSPVAELRLEKPTPSIVTRVRLFFRRLFARREIEREVAKVKGVPEELAKSLAQKAKPKKVAASLMELVKKPKEALLGAPPAAKEAAGAVGFGAGFGWWFVQALRGRRKETAFTDKKVEFETSTVRSEALRRKVAPELRAQVEEITATALTEEARRIKSILEKRKALKIYQPSFFGALANVTIKKISLWLLDNFPNFFKELYQTLRLANIKILSNTYVNIMVFGVISAFIVGLFLFVIIFSFLDLPLRVLFVRTATMAFLLSLVTFAGFYSYPTAKMKNRRKSINTNLSFVINHMGAVASSGVPPTKMFKLIAQSTEYGEVSVEIEKIVNYVEVFGYDVLTAIKTVAATTPSPAFKEFFEGMISTTQSGGDIKAYLSQKAKEAMLTYKLDRKKYTETISTYSDIYTGILIAAPLFFVAALSLVSLLGGKVGGVDVNIITVVGTYMVIPVLNICFITFLELTQPEV
ncbi:type II secretion system F family protein [Candidatus Woesearchaeota archaeon]|nr:type II secretion system F family protein [Candidatus Woesearchaeota archaeon]